LEASGKSSAKSGIPGLFSGTETIGSYLQKDLDLIKSSKRPFIDRRPIIDFS